MAIRRLHVEGFRSIDDIDLTLGELNALIGPNNAGKSNILRALNLVIGETWPIRPFTPSDRHNHDLAREIIITVTFDRPLAADADVRGFRLTYGRDESVEYVPIDDAGDICRYPGGRDKRVTAPMRDGAAMLLVGLDRQADRQLRASQWTLYGKLLRRIERDVTQVHRDAFSADVARSIQTNLQAALTPVQTVLQEFVRRQTGLRSELRFRAVDPLDVLRDVRPCIIDGGAFDVDDVGAGVQSAVTIAIAKAYADHVRAPVLIAIEEPELFLHPHGCRHFYRLLNEITGPHLQIIYTTHNRAFVNAGEFEQVHLVRKRDGQTEVTSGSRLEYAGARDRLRLQTRFNERISEALFANVVVLTEGEPDEIAVRCAVENQGLQLDQDSVSVLGVGGKTEVMVLAELISAFGVPTIAVLDEDPGDAASAANLARVQATISNANVFIQTPNLEGLVGLASKPSKVEAMLDFPHRFRAGQAVPLVYQDLAARIRALLA